MVSKLRVHNKYSKKPKSGCKNKVEYVKGYGDISFTKEDMYQDNIIVCRSTLV